MKKLILPIVLGLVGLTGGAGAGWMLRPAPPPVEAEPLAEAPAFVPPPSGLETLQLPNHFVVPVLGEGSVRSMMIMNLALELTPDHGITLARHEARMRSIFLQALFDHSNLGGFEGVYTSGEALLTLRRTLREAARAELGDVVHDVLITEILRQES
jgi:flagellar protein FliL